MPNSIYFKEMLLLAFSDHWEFCVGRVGARWLGFAMGRIGPNRNFINIFHQVAEGHQLGLPDRDHAIRLTTALIEADVECMGAVTFWITSPELRGRPEDFTCAHCGEVGCDGADCQDSGPDDYP